jgi:hypothetical protein
VPSRLKARRNDQIHVRIGNGMDDATISADFEMFLEFASTL